MPVRRTTALGSACAGLALAGALLAGGSPAVAASTTPSTAPSAGSAAKDPAQAQAKAVCARAPKVDARLTRALDRLHGSAHERGSIARMQKRVDLAKSAGQTAIATYLGDRLTNRQNLVGTLTTRQTDLKSVETWCTANNLGPR
ncbi:hypothetical protein [Streptacidiphilus cavernicola]|uniref:Haemophore haem-binding domain-containing protein n=1 Tax=Streptacidiphilus cavernicola TaxID=3342716 RepID=A0ABV6VTS1_9ACTN